MKIALNCTEAHRPPPAMGGGSEEGAETYMNLKKGWILEECQKRKKIIEVALQRRS